MVSPARPMIVVALFVVLGLTGVLAWRRSTPQDRQPPPEFRKLADGRLLFQLPGLRDVELQPAEHVRLGDDAEVVGVRIGKQACCFVLAAMSVPRLQDYRQTAVHVVNLVFCGQPLAVTYCDARRCVRVFRGPKDRRGPPQLAVGGWSPQDGLLLWHQGKRYPQGSPELPLPEVACSLSTWGQWRRQHPGTLVYTGPRGNP